LVAICCLCKRRKREPGQKTVKRDRVKGKNSEWDKNNCTANGEGVYAAVADLNGQ
jgi:hypothetical protein